MFDYALTYDKKINSGDRVFRLNPYYIFYDDTVDICENSMTIEKS